MGDTTGIPARGIVRMVPYLFMVSPSTGREVKIRLDDGLKPADAQDLASRCETSVFADSPIQVLHSARLVNLVAAAQDWRFMDEAEIEDYLARDARAEAGASLPDDDEITPDGSNNGED